MFPLQPVPSLTVPLVGGANFDIAAEQPRTFSLVVFYRGAHCPVCKAQLKDLEANLDNFEARGVSVVAISSDGQERAAWAKADWQLPRLRIGFGLRLQTARRWGLFISKGQGKTSLGLAEPELFSEPALYLVRPDGTLYFGIVQTMPFVRPRTSDILAAIDYVLKRDYPARGEVLNLAID